MNNITKELDFTEILLTKEKLFLVQNSLLSHRIITNISEMPKARANKTGLNIMIVHFYIRRKIDIIRYDIKFLVWLRTGSSISYEENGSVKMHLLQFQKLADFLRFSKK